MAKQQQRRLWRRGATTTHGRTQSEERENGPHAGPPIASLLITKVLRLAGRSQPVWLAGGVRVRAVRGGQPCRGVALAISAGLRPRGHWWLASWGPQPSRSDWYHRANSWKVPLLSCPGMAYPARPIGLLRLGWRFFRGGQPVASSPRVRPRRHAAPRIAAPGGRGSAGSRAARCRHPRGTVGTAGCTVITPRNSPAVPRGLWPVAARARMAGCKRGPGATAGAT